MQKKPSFIHKTSLGQNFLVDKNILGKILEYAAVSSMDVILEVGSGMGVLTSELASSGCRKVYSIEIDRRLDPFLAPLKEKYSNLSIIWADAVKYDFGKMDPFPTKMVANIPYNITTPLLWELITIPESKQLNYFLIMVQKEAAERICAPPGTKERYPLGITIEAMGKARILRTIPPRAFRPIPKVESALLEIRINKEFSYAYDRIWRNMLKTGFAQRRKKLANNLITMSGKLDKDILAQLMEKLKIDALSRAEQLSTEEWIKLYEGLKSVIG